MSCSVPAAALGRVLLAALLFPVSAEPFRWRRLLLSARAWVLFLLLVIAALVAYYVLSDRYTPFTTDAYVQAYVIQVAPRVEGQVVHVHVQENQAVNKGELLFEIDPRPFEHRTALLEAKRVEAVQQVAQLEAELSAAKAEDDPPRRRGGLRPDGPRAGEGDLQTGGHHGPEVRGGRPEIQGGAGGAGAGPRRRSARPSRRWRRGSAKNMRWSRRSRRSSPRPGSTWNGRAIYAPANGYVTNVQLREGSYVHVGMPVLTCIDGDQWWVVGQLPREQPGERPAGAARRPHLQHLPGANLSRGGGVRRLGRGSGPGRALGQPAGHPRAAELDSARPALPGADHPRSCRPTIPCASAPRPVWPCTPGTTTGSTA